MADLYLDNDVSLRLAPLLRIAGHEVVTTRGLGVVTATDDAQLLTAAQDGWILVTPNRRDFRLLHDAWRTWAPAFGLALPSHPGILVLDPAPSRQCLDPESERYPSTHCPGQSHAYGAVASRMRNQS